jgi:hypothetical protein
MVELYGRSSDLLRLSAFPSFRLIAGLTDSGKECLKQFIMELTAAGTVSDFHEVPLQTTFGLKIVLPQAKVIILV